MSHRALARITVLGITKAVFQDPNRFTAQFTQIQSSVILNGVIHFNTIAP